MPDAALTADHADAALLAEEAGRLLLAIRAGIDALEPAEKVRDAGDRRSHELLTDRLAHLHPGDAVLSEEGVDDPARLEAGRVWVVDPLDGTREFG
ncbi:MAG TPA: inositol monophosphatase family protein, partial [Acidimicrobiales bacterium]